MTGRESLVGPHAHTAVNFCGVSHTHTHTAITMDYMDADPFALREGSPEVDNVYRQQCLDILHNDFRNLAKMELQGAMSANKYRYGPSRKALQKELDDGNALAVLAHYPQLGSPTCAFSLLDQPVLLPESPGKPLHTCWHDVIMGPREPLSLLNP
jgi:hypothetical protein